jgi:histidinol phosphatase-like PHP family hydrolase
MHKKKQKQTKTNKCLEINTKKQHTKTQNLIACAHKKHINLFKQQSNI